MAASDPGGPSGPNPVDLLPKVAPSPLSASDWPSYGRDLSNTRTGGTDAPSYNEVPTLGPVWSFPSSDGDFTGTPVVADGTLVAASGGGTVFALDASTGALKWSRDLNQPINGSAAIADGRVVVPVAQVSSPHVVALNLSDGSHSLLDIAERSQLPFAIINRTAEVLREHGLLRPTDSISPRRPNLVHAR